MSQRIWLYVLTVFTVMAVHSLIIGHGAVGAEQSCVAQSGAQYESRIEIVSAAVAACMEPIGYVSMLSAATRVIAAPSALVRLDDQTPSVVEDSYLALQIDSPQRLPDHLRISIYEDESESLGTPISFHECFGERLIFADREPTCDLAYIANEDGDRVMRISVDLHSQYDAFTYSTVDEYVLLVEAVWLPEPIPTDGQILSDHQWWQLPFSIG